MKKFILLLMLIVSGAAMAQDTTCVLPWQSFASVKMTASVDTVDVQFGTNQKYDQFTISVYSSAADTLTVWTLGRDGSSWSQKALVDLASSGVVQSAAASTAKKEFIILDPQPLKIRVISSSDDGSTDSVVVMGKYGVSVPGLSRKPSSVIDTAVFTRPANATAYQAGDVVRSTSAAQFISVAVAGNAGDEAWINWAALCADTSNVSNANFMLMVYIDTVGVGNYVAADNALFQQSYAFGAKRLPPISFALKTYGTAAGGATGAWDTQSVSGSFIVPSSRRLYLLLICDGAYTPKQSGSFRISVSTSSY